MDWPSSRASQRLHRMLGFDKTRSPYSMKRDRIGIDIEIGISLRNYDVSYLGGGFASTIHRRKNYEYTNSTQQLSQILLHLQSSTQIKQFPEKQKKVVPNSLKKRIRIYTAKWMNNQRITPLRFVVYVVLLIKAFITVHFLLVILNPFPTFTSLLPTCVIQKQLSITPKNETSLMLPGKELNYQCVAWRATSDCSPDGPRLSESAISTIVKTDVPCDQVIPTMGSGYCELKSQSGEIVKAVKKSCPQGYPRIGQYQPYFRCDMAASFLTYKDRALQFDPSPSLQSSKVKDGLAPTRGIVIEVYPRLLASTYAIIKSLREIHHCQLPIELWCINGELSDQNPLIKAIMAYGKINVRYIEDSNVHTYMAKPYSIAYSKFDQVLFLDSDNFPVKDTSYLFDMHEFQSTGALFWKDYWMASRDEFFITRNSLIWELLGIPPDSPFINEQEMESGQIVIDRRKCEKALKVLLFLAKTFDEFIQPMSLLLGDKDLFRIAFKMTETPYHYIKDPPGLAGPKPLPLLSKDKVCGLSFVQYDPSSEPVFLHRNFAKIVQETSLIKRLLGIFWGSPITASTVWQKGVKFTGDHPESQYAVNSFFSLWQKNMCYHPRGDVREHFEEIDYSGTGIEYLDRKIVEWALEGMQINS